VKLILFKTLGVLTVLTAYYFFYFSVHFFWIYATYFSQESLNLHFLHLLLLHGFVVLLLVVTLQDVEEKPNGLSDAPVSESL